MSLLGGSISITGVSFMLFCVFAIAVIGYGLGRITIKGVNLGTAGVFIVALLFGCFFFEPLKAQLVVKGASEAVPYVDNALKVIETFGLILFVTAVGFIAGPKFFGNFKKNFKSYVVLGLVISIMGGLTTLGCILVGRNFESTLTNQ
jgi:putative transport protein